MLAELPINSGVTTSPISAANGIVIDDLHAQVVQGDLRQIEVICEWLLKKLRRAVSLALPSADPHLADASIDDTIMAYLYAPSRYDPSRGTLIAWLTRCAINRARDARRSVSRRLAHEVTVGVTLTHLLPAGDDGDTLQDGWIEERRRQLLSLATSDEERRFIMARLEGAPWDVQAAALGIHHTTPAESRRATSRAWDLLRRRLRWRQARRWSGSRVDGPTG